MIRRMSRGRTEQSPTPSAGRVAAGDASASRSRSRWSTAAGAALVTVPGVVLLNAPSAAAWVPYCGESQFVHEIQVEDWADGHQKISVTPKGHSRVAVDANGATIAMWHAVQDCVAGLYGGRADTIYDQLECHQHFGAAWFATGDTYDLETWRPTFGPSEWVSSHCGNELGTDPAGPVRGHYRPDAGVTDLEGAFDSVA